MEWLNYHHLFYFWTVAKEGTITAACEKLRLAQPTISAQLRTLENALGEKLFERTGRYLTLTETGQLVFQYADDIFSLGHEMLATIRDQPAGKPTRLKVGIADVVPKLIVYRVLEPALSLDEPVHLICTEGKPSDLLMKLSVHELDVVLSDHRLSPDVNVRAFSHQLGQSNITVLGTPSLAGVYQGNFPDSLDGAPFLFPTSRTVLRKSLDQWFESKEMHPLIKGEFDDSALQNIFAQAGLGLVPVPSVIREDMKRRYGLQYVGRLPEVKEQFYAISLEKRVKHPAVMAILERARETIFR